MLDRKQLIISLAQAFGPTGVYIVAIWPDNKNLPKVGSQPMQWERRRFTRLVRLNCNFAMSSASNFCQSARELEPRYHSTQDMKRRVDCRMQFWAYTGRSGRAVLAFQSFCRQGAWPAHCPDKCRRKEFILCFAPSPTSLRTAPAWSCQLYSKELCPIHYKRSVPTALCGSFSRLPSASINAKWPCRILQPTLCGQAKRK